MFSYTDDAIVTSSPTGRHLSTVIRRPASIGPLDWSEHAEQVCRVLNELDSKAKASCLSLHMQTVGRIDPGNYDASAHATTAQQFAQRAVGPTIAELIDPGHLWPIPGTRFMARSPSAERIAELEKQLDDATTKLCAAQMLLEKPIEVTADLCAVLFCLSVGGTTTHNNRTFKRVE